MIDFTLGPELDELRERVGAFITDVVIPAEPRDVSEHGLDDGLGVSGDVPLGRYLAEMRPFRIYDGPTETHKWAIARRALRDRERAAART
jgi:alkylation response protein AidB-like acyl-CoA dehydrogenase